MRISLSGRVALKQTIPAELEPYGFGKLLRVTHAGRRRLRRCHVSTSEFATSCVKCLDEVLTQRAVRILAK